jgi:ABC-type lipoprotein release transport system permease subunit
VAGHIFLVPGRPLNMVYAPPPVGTGIDRFKMLEGRLPRTVDEIAVGFAFADSHHVEIGSRIPMELAPTESVSEGRRATPVRLSFRVVGIEASPGEFPPQLDSTFPSDFAHVSRAAWDAQRDKVFALDETVVRLRRGGADIPRFVDELHRLVGGQPQVNLIRSQQAANVQRSIHLQAVALWLLGGLLGLVTLGVLSQLLARSAFVEAADNDTLRSLGMVRSQLFALGMIRAAAIGLLAAAIGAAIAVVASPLTPIGIARTAEIHPGMTVDGPVLGLGAAATLALVLAVSAWPAWRATAVDRNALSATLASRPSALARASAALALPPAANAGVRMAVEPGRGRTAVPVRSSLLAVVVAVAALVGTVTFGAGLNRLLATPRLYGWNWDAHVIANGEDTSADDIVRLLKNNDRVAALAAEDTPPLAIGATEFDGLFLRQAKGAIEPVLLEGRAPRGRNEVALGSETLRQVHAHVGSSVTIRITAIGAHPARFRVVGRAVMRPQSSTARLGRGAVLDYSAEDRLVPPGVDVPPLSDAELRLAPGVDRARALAAIRTQLGDDFEVTTAERPADLVNFGRVQNLPLILGAIVAVLGAATLAQTLMTSIRRRRRELSILKTLGFTQFQVRMAVAWQATVSVVLAVVIGLPLGVAAGRLAWTAFATRLGAVPDAVTPVLLLAVTLPAAVVLANLIAAAPAAIASRMRPAQVLRTE